MPLTIHDVESLRRSRAMAPLADSTVAVLLDEFEHLLRERQRMAAILADLPESMTALRTALNRLHQLVGGSAPPR